LKEFLDMFYSCELYINVGFRMVVLQQTLFLEILVVFSNLETKKLVFGLWILRKI